MKDGSITFSTALDNEQMEKDLAALTKKIAKKEREIAEITVKRDAGREKSLFDAAALDAEKAKLQELRDRVADIRAMSKDKGLSPMERENAKVLLPSVQEELNDQRAQVNAMQAEWNRLENSIDRYDQALKTAGEDLERQKGEAGYLQQRINDAEQSRAEVLSSAQVADQHIVDLNRELLELKARQTEMEQLGLGLGHEEYDQAVARIGEINGELKKYQKNLFHAADGAEEAARGTERISEASKRANGYMNNFGKRLKGILASAFVFNILSSGLRQFTAWAGKSVRANDEARAAIARLKGALLTLAQPLVEVVIPAFTLLVNILARVVTAVAQFVSAIFGKTLSQSKNGAKALYEEAEAIQGVGAAADGAAGSLAGFDEINTISAENAGGGGGGGAGGDIAPDFSWLDDGNGIFDRLKEIADLVALIAAGFALWKIGSILPGVLGDIATKLGGILMTVGGLILFWSGLTDAWENGVDWLNLIEMIGGLAAAALGLYLLLGPIAAGLALVVGGLGMLITGFRDAMANGWNLENTLLSIAGLLAAGLGISLLTGSWIPLLIAGIAGVLLALTVATGHGEELVAGIRMVLEGFADFFGGIFSGDLERAAAGIIKIFDGLKTALWAIVDGLRDSLLVFLDWLDEKTNGRFHGIIMAAKGFVTDLFRDVKTIMEGFAEFFTGIFTGDIQRASDGIAKIFDGLKNAVFTIVDGIKNMLVSFLDWLDEKTGGRFHGILETAKSFVSAFAEAAKNTIGGMLDAVQLMFTGLIKFLVGVFTLDWKLAWEGVKDIFKGMWNHMVSMLEGAVNLIISGLNWMIAQMNKIRFTAPDWVPVIGGSSFGFNIPSISEVQIPRLAQGAVIPPNREFMAVLGDQRQGNNLEAPEGLIRRIVREESGGANTALLEAILEAIRAGHVIMVDRRVLGQVVTQEQNRMTRSSGRSVVLG